MQKPESGFLGFQMYAGLAPVIIQYWKSFEQMDIIRLLVSIHFAAKNPRKEQALTVIRNLYLAF